MSEPPLQPELPLSAPRLRDAAAILRHTLVDVQTQWTLTQKTQCREHLGDKDGKVSDPLAEAYMLEVPLALLRQETGRKGGYIPFLSKLLLDEWGLTPEQVRVKQAVGKTVVRLEIDRDAFEAHVKSLKDFAASVNADTGKQSKLIERPMASEARENIYRKHVSERLFNAAEGTWLPEQEGNKLLHYACTIDFNAAPKDKILEAIASILKENKVKYVFELNYPEHAPHPDDPEYMPPHEPIDDVRLKGDNQYFLKTPEPEVTSVTVMVSPKQFDRLKTIIAARQAEALGSRGHH